MRGTHALKVFLTCLCQAAGHFLWLMENSTHGVSVTFGEAAGVPSSGILLKMIADKISLSSHDGGGQQNITLSTQSSGPSHSQLVGHINALPPFTLRLSATFGIFKGNSLLQYWSSADVVKRLVHNSRLGSSEGAGDYNS